MVRTVPYPSLLPCPGPLVWFTVPPNHLHPDPAAILECASCRSVVTTGNFLDVSHLRTPVIRSPR